MGTGDPTLVGAGEDELVDIVVVCLLFVVCCCWLLFFFFFFFFLDFHLFLSISFSLFLLLLVVSC